MAEQVNGNIASVDYKPMQIDAELIGKSQAYERTYHRIGETLVLADGLMEVLSILIDDYTVDKLNRTGDLISPDLIDFKEWVSRRLSHE